MKICRKFPPFMSLLIQVMPVSKVIMLAGANFLIRQLIWVSTRLQERDKLHNLLFTPDDAGVKGKAS